MRMGFPWHIASKQLEKSSRFVARISREFRARATVVKQYAWLQFSRRIRAYYIGWLGYGNLGDEIIYASTSDLFSDDVIFCTLPKAGMMAQAMGIRRPMKGVVLGGGTLIHYASYLQRAGQGLDVFPDAKLIVFGTGVGDVDMWERFGAKRDINGWRQLLERAVFLGVRGPLSKMFLENWGVSNKIEIIGDPAMWCARSRITPRAQAKRIGLNLGSSNGNIHGRNEQAVLNFGAQLIRYLVQDGWDVTLFPVIQDDLDYLRQAVAMARVGSLRVNDRFLDVTATMSALEAQDVFIGEKLHSVVLASCVYTPAIMLEYRTKCRDFMASIGREKYTYRTDELDIDSIVGSISELYENTEEHQAHLYSQVQHCKTLLKAAAQKVKRILLS